MCSWAYRLYWLFGALGRSSTRSESRTFARIVTAWLLVMVVSVLKKVCSGLVKKWGLALARNVGSEVGLRVR